MFCQKKKKSSNTVTLRAPKHFKIGRHHYQTITKYFHLIFKNFKTKNKINENDMYKNINILKNILIKKKISKTITLLLSIKITLRIDTTLIIY